MKKIPFGWLVTGAVVAVGGVAIAIYEKMKAPSAAAAIPGAATQSSTITPARVTGAEATFIETIQAGQHVTNPTQMASLPPGIVFMAQNGMFQIPRPPAGTSLTAAIPSSASFPASAQGGGLTVNGKPVIAAVGYGPQITSYAEIALGSDLKSPFSLSAAQLQNVSVVAFEWIDANGKLQNSAAVLT